MSNRRTLVAALLTAAAPLPLGSQLPAREANHGAAAVIDYQVTLNFPDTGRAIDARAVLTVDRRAPLDTLALDLVGLSVDSVLRGDRPVAFARSVNTLRVALPRLTAAADTLRVAVWYHGIPTDGLVITTDAVGEGQAFADNFPDRARSWIPSIDHPSGKATVTWIVSAPIDRTVVANGAFVQRIVLPAAEGQRRRARTLWRSAHAIPVYTMVIAVARLVDYALPPVGCDRAQRWQCLHQTVYVAPEERPFLPGPFTKAGDIVEFFASLVGPFPYEQLAHVESTTRFGGMENAGAIFYADALFRTRALTAGVIAHETAHQWFGDAVTEREWGHIWLSEGFATYFEQLWWRHAEGETSFQARMTRLRADVIASPIVRHRPVVDTAETHIVELLNVNSYQKGAWVLHMLRTMLGDSTFFAGLRDFIVRHRDGTALTSDLQRALEDRARVDLGWFFEEWLTRPGYPELRFTWRYDQPNHRVTLDLVQGSRFGAFRFPLTVGVEGSDGSSHRLRIHVPATSIASIDLPLDLAYQPVRVVLDPDIELLATVSGN
ncbi:MAG: M1 family metallopeptidase [Gemmatimonadaceae bacterium]